MTATIPTTLPTEQELKSAINRLLKPRLDELTGYIAGAKDLLTELDYVRLEGNVHPEAGHA